MSLGANGEVYLLASGTVQKYTYNGGNSYTHTTNAIGAIQNFNTEGLGVAANGDMYLTCYNCGANNNNAYVVFKLSGGVVTTIQNGDGGINGAGTEGPWGGGQK